MRGWSSARGRDPLDRVIVDHAGIRYELTLYQRCVSAEAGMHRVPLDRPQERWMELPEEDRARLHREACERLRAERRKG